MKFSCEKDKILKEISIAAEIISSRNSLSILSNVLLETRENLLKIRATDLKVSFETDIPVETGQAGSTTIFCDKLLGILRSLPEGEVEFEMKEEGLLFIKPRLKKIDFRLKSIASEKYPEFKEISGDSFFPFPQKDFMDMIRKTIFAVSDDETRYFMNGVFMEKNGEQLLMVATDGRRLSYITKKADPRVQVLKGIIIPPKVLNLARKLSSGEGEFLIAVDDTNIFLSFDRHRISSNLIDAQFPNYQRVIPLNQEHQVVLMRGPLLEALKRVSLLVEQKSRRILLSFQPDILTVNSSEGEIGMAMEELPCEYQGPEMTIAVNYLYLLEPLKEMEEEKVIIQFTEPDKAVTLKPFPEQDHFHIVMPMQIS
jgi:DNA polymerase-3 subunit beta